VAKAQETWGTVEVRAGDVLAEKYRVEDILGVGGMGVVVLATHVVLKERVALKFLQREMIDDATVARFTREAQAAARIKSPYVARVLDVGTLPSGTPYMVMEYLEGHDLGYVLQRDGSLPAENVARHCLQICEALAAAHAIGIIHRDVKPSNLFLTQGDDGGAVVKVLDFGVSKHRDLGEMSSITKSDHPMGTPSYMSPEQVRSARTVDARADIWSLGVVLYELSTGRLPFEAENLHELIAQLIDKEFQPPRPRSLRPDLPLEFERIILRCLERDPRRRFPDVAALADSLAPFAGEGATSSVARCHRILSNRRGIGSAPGNEPPPANDTVPEGPVEHDTSTAFGKTGRRIVLPSRRALALALGGAGGFGLFALILASLRSSPATNDHQETLATSAAASRSASAVVPGTAPQHPSSVPGIAVTPVDGVHLDEIPLDPKEEVAAARKPPAGAKPSLSGGRPLPSASPSAKPAPPPAANLVQDLSSPYQKEDLANPYR
jgi:serine/threonine protein kinase